MHPTIDLLITRLPVVLRRIVTGLNHALVLGFCGFMVWFGTRFAIGRLGQPERRAAGAAHLAVRAGRFCFGLMIVRYLQVIAGGSGTSTRTGRQCWLTGYPPS
jgi:TRAP-type C4-dicarboxylate transport system permease small subunit